MSRAHVNTDEKQSAWLALTKAQHAELQDYLARDGKTVTGALTAWCLEYIHAWREHLKDPDGGKEETPQCLPEGSGQ